MIYHSGLTTDLIKAYAKINPTDKLKVFLSYGRRNKYNYDLMLNNRHLIDKIACDSGTWTLNQNPEKNRSKINLKGYAAFLKLYASKFDFYINYDEEFTPNGFEENCFYQKELESDGLNPVPVIHNCDSSEEMDYYIQNGYKMVAIGSGDLRSSSVHKLRKIVETFYCKGIKVHFLGCTEYEKLANTPLYSCDSSSWGQKATRGYILYWNPVKRGEDKTDAIDFQANQHGRTYYKDYKFRWDLEEYLESELSMTFEQLEGKEGVSNRILATIHYFVKLEKLIAEKHKELGFLPL
jgi:hypothetical protein